MRRTLTTILSAAALLALPVAAEAAPGKGKGPAKRCGKAQKVGYSVHGTLVSYTADNPSTAANEGTITITVTSANSHARKSGDIPDQDANASGVQVAGAPYTVTTADPFKVKLQGFEGADTPSPGDAVHVTGKIARTKAKCAPAGTSVADRYAAPDVRRVTIADRDADV